MRLLRGTRLSTPEATADAEREAAEELERAIAASRPPAEAVPAARRSKVLSDGTGRTRARRATPQP